MTIKTTSGTMPTMISYTTTVNAAPPRQDFLAAYSRYLRLRAETFDAGIQRTDAEMYALIRSETNALAEAALAPAVTLEDFGLKLQMLQSQLAEICVEHPAALLMAGLTADLRRL